MEEEWVKEEMDLEVHFQFLDQYLYLKNRKNQRIRNQIKKYTQDQILRHVVYYILIYDVVYILVC